MKVKSQPGTLVERNIETMIVPSFLMLKIIHLGDRRLRSWYLKRLSALADFYPSPCWGSDGFSNFKECSIGQKKVCSHVFPFFELMI